MPDIRLETIRMHVRNKSCLLAGEAEYLLKLMDRANEHALQCDSLMHDTEEKLGDLFYAGQNLLRAWDEHPHVNINRRINRRVEILRKLVKEIAPCAR